MKKVETKQLRTDIVL